MSKILKVYAAPWCYHCKMTVKLLDELKIPYIYMEIEKTPPEVIKKIIEVNGGIDWVIPTMEYNGKWRKGKIFKREEVILDLRDIGIEF